MVNRFAKKERKQDCKKEIRVSNHSFSNIFRDGGKNCDGEKDE